MKNGNMTEFFNDGDDGLYAWDRYGKAEIKRIWSLLYRQQLYRMIWVSFMENFLSNKESPYYGYGEIRNILESSLLPGAIAMEDWELREILHQESITQHDLESSRRVFVSRLKDCGLEDGARYVHHQMTSSDITDNAESLQIFLSLKNIIPDLYSLFKSFLNVSEGNKKVLSISFTHMCPAYITTFSQQISEYAHELAFNLFELFSYKVPFKGHGGVNGLKSFEWRDSSVKSIFKFLSLSERYGYMYDTCPQVTQTNNRYRILHLMNLISGLGSFFYRFSASMRFLHSVGLVIENNMESSGYVGSTAMPYKNNPTTLESITSLSRTLNSLCSSYWQLSSDQIMERTLDDSAQSRFVLPQVFLILSELVVRTKSYLDKMRFSKTVSDKIRSENISKFVTKHKLDSYNGEDRQKRYFSLRESYGLISLSPVADSQYPEILDIIAECYDSAINCLDVLNEEHKNLDFLYHRNWVVTEYRG